MLEPNIDGVVFPASHEFLWDWKPPEHTPYQCKLWAAESAVQELLYNIRVGDVTCRQWGKSYGEQKSWLGGLLARQRPHFPSQAAWLRKAILKSPWKTLVSSPVRIKSKNVLTGAFCNENERRAEPGWGLVLGPMRWDAEVQQECCRSSRFCSRWCEWLLGCTRRFFFCLENNVTWVSVLPCQLGWVVQPAAWRRTHWESLVKGDGKSQLLCTETARLCQAAASLFLETPNICSQSRQTYWSHVNRCLDSVRSLTTACSPQPDPLLSSALFLTQNAQTVFVLT